MENILGILFLATFIEGLITYIFGESSENTTRPWIKYISLILGVGCAVAYRIDIPAAAGLVGVYPVVGFILSGLVIGRGANYVNDIVALVRGAAK